MTIFFNIANSLISFYQSQEPSSVQVLKNIFDKITRAEELNPEEVHSLHSLAFHPKSLKDKVLSLGCWLRGCDPQKKLK
jgi:hypothetical protein